MTTPFLTGIMPDETSDFGPVTPASEQRMSTGTSGGMGGGGIPGGAVDFIMGQQPPQGGGGIPSIQATLGGVSSPQPPNLSQVGGNNVPLMALVGALSAGLGGLSNAPGAAAGGANAGMQGIKMAMQMEQTEKQNAIRQYGMKLQQGQELRQRQKHALSIRKAKVEAVQNKVFAEVGPALFKVAMSGSAKDLVAAFTANQSKIAVLGSKMMPMMVKFAGLQSRQATVRESQKRTGIAAGHAARAAEKHEAWKKYGVPVLKMKFLAKATHLGLLHKVEIIQQAAENQNRILTMTDEVKISAALKGMLQDYKGLYNSKKIDAIQLAFLTKDLYASAKGQLKHITSAKIRVKAATAVGQANVPGKEAQNKVAAFAAVINSPAGRNNPSVAAQATAGILDYAKTKQGKMTNVAYAKLIGRILPVIVKGGEVSSIMAKEKRKAITTQIKSAKSHALNMPKVMGNLYQKVAATKKASVRKGLWSQMGQYTRYGIQGQIKLAYLGQAPTSVYRNIPDHRTFMRQAKAKGVRPMYVRPTNGSLRWVGNKLRFASGFTPYGGAGYEIQIQKATGRLFIRPIGLPGLKNSMIPLNLPIPKR